MENGLEGSRMERLLGMGELVPLVGHKPSKQNISIDYIFSAGGEARKNRRTKRIYQIRVNNRNDEGKEERKKSLIHSTWWRR